MGSSGDGSSVQAPPVRRQVRLAARRPYSFGDFQKNYLNYRTRRLIPSTEIVGDYGDVFYVSNAVGCRGAEVRPGVPAVALMGDSVMHGFEDDWLAKHVVLDGCQTINGGIEAMLLPWIVDRTLELRDALPQLVCAAVHSGWHNVSYNERSEAYWASELDRLTGIPVIAHFRLVADINNDIVLHGYEQAFADVQGYQPWGGFDHGTEAGRRGFVEDIRRFNTFIEGYCRERGRILIDLEPATAPATRADIGRSFLDFIHPSPAAYEAMARVIEARLGDAVRAAAADLAQGRAG